MAEDLKQVVRGIVPTAPRWRPTNLATNDGATLNSVYTEREPRPGTPVATNVLSELVSEVSNAQSTDLVFEVTDAGLPGTRGAAISYRKTSEPTPARRGWSEPNFLSGWTTQIFTTDTNPRVTMCVTLPSTQEVLGLQRLTGAGFVTTFQLFDPETWVWTNKGGFTDGFQSDVLIALRGSERVLTIQFPGTTVQEVRARYSDDKGTTWTDYTRHAIRNPAQASGGSVVTINTVRGVALDDGSVILIVTTGPLKSSQQILTRASQCA